MHLGPMSPSLLPTPAALASCYLIPWPILLLLISRSVFHLLEHGVSSQELTQPTKGDIEQVTLSKQRRSSQKNPQEVLVRLSTATDDFCLSYAGVDATTAIEILKELDQQVEGRYRVTYNSVQRVLNLLFMLSYIHECIQVWLTDYKSDMLSGGILSRSDSCSLRFLGSPSMLLLTLLSHLSTLLTRCARGRQFQWRLRVFFEGARHVYSVLFIPRLLHRPVGYASIALAIARASILPR